MAAALTDDDPDEVTDVIFEIAQICGFFTSHGKSSDCPRLKLIQSILQLSGSLDAMKNCDETLHSELRSSMLHSLLDCEEKIRCVRRDADSFLASITADRSETLMLLENLSRDVECRRGLACIVFGRSLISHFHRQSQREEELVRTLQTKLDDIYTEWLASDRMEKMDILRITSHCLERDALLGQIKYRDAVNFLLHPNGSCKSPLYTDGLGRQPTPLACSQRKTTTECTHRKGFVGPARTAWEIFQAFQRSSESGNLFSYSILVVGDEGSGKTHLCNEMERSVQSSTIGESI